MSEKFKQREQYAPRNTDLMENLLAGKGGPHKDKRKKRAKEKENLRNLIEDDDYDDTPRAFRPKSKDYE